MKTTITRKAVEPFVTVDEFKNCQSINGGSKDNELTSVLETATVEVEDSYNVALRSMTMRLVGESDGEFVKLYYPSVLSVESVTDLEGSSVEFRYIAPISAIKLTHDNAVVVDYKVVACDNATTYKSRVISRAVLIFNGEV